MSTLQPVLMGPYLCTAFLQARFWDCEYCSVHKPGFYKINSMVNWLTLLKY